MENKYTIELNQKQLLTLQWVTEMACRTICGQLDMFQNIAEEAYNKDHKTEEHPHAIGSSEWYDMREKLEEHLNHIRALCWECESGRCYGIGYNDKADELWDMYQVLRKFRFDHIFSEEERERMRWTVMSDEPMHTSNEPLIIVKEK